MLITGDFVAERETCIFQFYGVKQMQGLRSGSSRVTDSMQFVLV